MIFIPTPEANILNDFYCSRFESGLAWPYADSESCSKTIAEQLNTVWLDLSSGSENKEKNSGGNKSDKRLTS